MQKKRRRGDVWENKWWMTFYIKQVDYYLINPQFFKEKKIRVCCEMTGTEKKKSHCYTYFLRSCFVVFIGKKNELNKRKMKKWFEGWLSWTVLHPRITFIKQQVFFIFFILFFLKEWKQWLLDMKYKEFNECTWI